MNEDDEEEELGICLLIDSEISIDIFNNKDYLKGIYMQKRPLKLHYNAGHIYVKKGWFDDIEVWYHPKSIANILSLKTFKKQHHVTYVSKDRDGVFKVFTKEGVVDSSHMKPDFITWTLKLNMNQECPWS